MEAIMDRDDPNKPNMDLLWAIAPASLICGWYHRQVGDEDAARRYWTKGMRFVAREIRPDHYVGNRTIEHFVMLAGLSEHPDHDTVRRATQILLNSDNPLISVAGPMIGSEKVEAIATQVWLTERGRKVALDFALDRTTKPQAAEDSVVLVGWYALRQSAFDSNLDDEHDKLVWEITKTIYEHIVLDGKLSTSQLVQLSAAWGGISGVLGWDGVANTLPPQTRGPFAYILSHRSRRQGQSAQAQKLLRDAADHAPPDTLLKRLAQQELDKPATSKPKSDPAP